jgi:8-oxo-dGTP pyrophosphatase MutT (NUDIX family)
MTEPKGMAPAEIDLLCPECDYNLTGASGARCSWCGAPIDYDAVIARATAPPSVLRVGAVVASLAVGLGSIFIVVALTRHHGVRRITEGIAMIGMLAASAGLLWIALLGIRRSNRWPIRNAEARSLLRLAGWISVLAGLVGAANMIDVGPDPKLVRGVEVYGGLEYVLAAMVFTFPAWVLLLMRHVSFRPDTPRPPEGQAGDVASTGSCPFDVSFAHRYRRDQVVVRASSARRTTTPQIEAHITRQWDAERAVAEQTGRTLFNGDLGRLVRAKPGDDALELHIGATTYKEFRGTNVHPDPSARRDRSRPAALDDDRLANPLGISATIITADGLIVLGRRSDRVALHAGYLHTFGGMLEAADCLADGTCDVFDCAIRELCEELPIKPHEIAELVITGLVRDRALAQPELLFDARVTIALEDLKERFESAARDFEHDALEWTRDDAAILPAFILHTRPIAPIAEAALLLHGRLRWGDPWYDTCRTELYP